MTAAEAKGVILVVDDDEEVRATVVSLLEPEGYTVVDVANGRQALDVLERDPTVQVLFTDVLMPGISGITLARKALARRPDLRIVLTSAYMREEDESVPYLKKPFRGEELLRAVAGEVRV